MSELRDAALAAGAVPSEEPAPDVLGCAARPAGRLATAEVAAVCQLPGPRAPLELWRLASEWQVKAEAAAAGELWSLA